jgi:hypothetical protein
MCQVSGCHGGVIEVESADAHDEGSCEIALCPVCCPRSLCGGTGRAVEVASGMLVDCPAGCSGVERHDEIAAAVTRFLGGHDVVVGFDPVSFSAAVRQ